MQLVGYFEIDRSQPMQEYANGQILCSTKVRKNTKIMKQSLCSHQEIQAP